MARHVPDQDAPITVATLRRLLTAAAVGCVLVAAASLALTAGLGTPTAAVFATIAGAILFAGCAFDIAETRAARRTGPARPAPAPELDPTALDLAVALVAQALAAETFDDGTEVSARLAIDALVVEPDLLDALHTHSLAADMLAAQTVPAGAGR